MRHHNFLEIIGKRMTKQRQAVYDALCKVSKPCSVSDLFKLIKQLGQSIDMASVYRNLAVLSKAGYVREIDFGEGKKRYEIISADNHHHHLVCEKCGHIEDISLDENDLMRRVEKQTKFKVKRHSLEFFGSCQQCVSTK